MSIAERWVGDLISRRCSESWRGTGDSGGDALDGDTRSARLQARLAGPPRTAFANPDQTAGVRIVARAIQAPLRQIAENAGADGAVVAGKVLESSDRTFGFNAQSELYGDMVAMGVIDPTKVVRYALEAAASVAGLLITTEAMVGTRVESAGGEAGMGEMAGMM